MPVALSLKIYVVGKLKDRNIEQKCDEYIKKITHDARFSIVEIKDSDKDSEGKKFLNTFQKENNFVFALSEFGKEYASVSFAKRLESINKPITFVIGGHHGLSDIVLANADENMALSKMTFTHEFARLILIEQIYRAISIINNRNYHRD